MFELARKVVVVGLLAALVGCRAEMDNFFTKTNPSSDPEGNQGSAELTAQALQIVQTSCTSCHTNYHDSWASLVTDRQWQEQGLVIAGNPDASPLIQRLKYGPGGALANMPASADLYESFSASHYQALRAWVLAMKVEDFVIPSILSSSPSAPLAAGTTQTSIQVVTSEAALCRYSLNANTDFDAMTLIFTASSNGLTHSAPVTGLQNGQSYTRYVRCKDLSGNEIMTDYVLSFQVLAGDQSPVRSNLLPVGALVAGTTSTTLSLQTTLSASCRYATTPGVSYNSMTQTFVAAAGGTAHTRQVTGLSNGQSYVYYVRCKDTASNQVNQTDAAINFSVSVPLTAQAVMTTYCYSCHPTWATYTDAQFQISGLVVAKSPSTSTLIKRTKYSGTIENMPAPIGGSAWNSFTIADFEALETWVDDMAIVNTDFTPPVRSQGAPMGALPPGTTQATISLATNELATCRYSTVIGVAYDQMPHTFVANGPGTQHTKPLTGLSEGQAYTYFVRCKDAANNANPSDYVISFSVMADVDVVPPTVSNPQPSGELALGTSSAIISVATSESATCRYAVTVGVSYNDMPHTMGSQNGGLVHQATVAGLESGSDYSYYIKCKDTAGNASLSDTLVSFSIPTLSGELLPSSDEKIRLGDRIFVKTFLDDIFGPSAAATTQTMIQNKLSLFGGPCDPMSSEFADCPNVDVSDPEAPILPTSFSPREGQRIKTCQVMVFNPAILDYTIQQITGNQDLGYLTGNPQPTQAQLIAAYKYFYSGQNPEGDLVAKMADLGLAAQEANKPKDPWRYVIYFLCNSPLWQSP